MKKTETDAPATDTPPEGSAWDSILEHAAAAERRGFVFAMTGAALSVIGGGSILYRLIRPGPSPLIAETCRGEVIALRSLDDAPARPKLEDIAEDLNAWVRGAREVSFDLTFIGRQTWRSYYLTRAGSQAEADLQAHHRANDPTQRARGENVVCEKQSALPQGGSADSNVWLLEWEEVTRARDGTLKSRVAWRCVATFVIVPPTTDPEAVRRNPRGIYMESFHWTALRDIQRPGTPLAGRPG